MFELPQRPSVIPRMRMNAERSRLVALEGLIMWIGLLALVLIAVTALTLPRSGFQTEKGDAIRRALRIAAGAGIAAMLLPFGVLLIGFYYFWANQAIPPFADRVQVGMLVLAGAAALVTVITLAYAVILRVRA